MKNPMKIVHVMLGLFYLVYTFFHIRQLGIGEIMSVTTTVISLLAAWFVFKKDLTGMFLSGIILGTAVEYLTEAYWDYTKLMDANGFNVFIYGDISLYVIMGWGFSFSVVILLSNWVFKSITRNNAELVVDARIIICDAVLGPVWFIMIEYLGMQVLHLWRYTECSNWTHIVPVIQYPFEGVIGAVLFAAILPTFVRHWEKKFRFTGSVETIISGTTS